MIWDAIGLIMASLYCKAWQVTFAGAVKLMYRESVLWSLDSVHVSCKHYSDVTWTLWRLTSPPLELLFNSLFKSITRNSSKLRYCPSAWWRHQMETFSALLAICAGNSSDPGEFPAQKPVVRSFDVFFDLRLHKRFSKQSWGWWFETPSGSLWRHCNAKHGR